MGSNDGNATSRGNQGNGTDGVVRYGDQEVRQGIGGETHQTTSDRGRALTTQQGVLIADDQNTLRVGGARSGCA